MRTIYLIFLILVFLSLSVVNLRLYHTPTKDEILKQLTFLKDELQNNNADIEMQKHFPEGYVFINALYGLTWCEIASGGKDELVNRAKNEAKSALKNLESEKAKKIFNKNLSPPYGIFYQGWTNYLRAKILMLEITSMDSGIFNNYLQSCRILGEVFDNPGTPYPETYYHSRWPADALPAIASLKIHDKLFPVKYKPVIEKWIAEVKNRLDPKISLIPHSVDAYGSIPGTPRGSSQTLILRLLPEIDTTFASEQYKFFRTKFVDRIIGVTVIKENSNNSSNMDVDSGPVIFGAGAAATIVGIGAARANGDTKLSKALESTVEALGVPFTTGQKKSYLLGNFQIADAFIAWSKATPLYVKKYTGNEYTNRIEFHIVSVLILAALLTPFWLLRRKGS